MSTTPERAKSRSEVHAAALQALEEAWERMHAERLANGTSTRYHDLREKTIAARRGIVLARLTRQSKPIRHGTANAYKNRGCRCADCRLAWADHVRDYQRARRRKQREAGA